jgi:hypothetical protein
MLGLSDSSRVDSVATRAQQYQRFSTAAPISNSPSLRSSSGAWIQAWNPSRHVAPQITRGFCRGGLALLEARDQTSFPDPIWQVPFKWTCPVCFQELHVRRREFNAGEVMNYRFILAQHMYNGQYGCLLCVLGHKLLHGNRRLGPMSEDPELYRHFMRHFGRLACRTFLCWFE